jgi:glycosyltransferase involved in cell wall biosynthesis
MLADKGWRVRHLGIVAAGAARALMLPKHPSISVALMPASSLGWHAVAQYVRFLAWCRSEVIRWRPDVIYCSDAKSYPVGLWASTLPGVKTILHEHDPPQASGGGRFMQLMRSVRRLFARRATLLVIPQDERARSFLADTGADPTRLHVVYNCASVREVDQLAIEKRGASQAFTLWYHGAIGPGQLPRTIIDAIARLPGDVRLEIAGYETLSSNGYVAQLLADARGLGLAERVTYHGALPLRAELMRTAANADIGLALFASQFRDPMVGASNKPFDYLACGLPLLTNRTPEWESFFGAEGVSIGCDPKDPDDIARAVLTLRNNPKLRRTVAETGRRLIQTKWSYEAQFAKVLEVISG